MAVFLMNTGALLGCCPICHGDKGEVGVPVGLVLHCHGQHLCEGFDAPLTLAITMGAEGCGLALLDAQELAYFLEEPGLELGALVTVEVGGSPVLGEPAVHKGVCHEGGLLVGHGESLHKFSEAVRSDQDVLAAMGCLREGAHKVNGDLLQGQSNREVMQGGSPLAGWDLVLGTGAVGDEEAVVSAGLLWSWTLPNVLLSWLPVPPLRPLPSGAVGAGLDAGCEDVSSRGSG